MGKSIKELSEVMGRHGLNETPEKIDKHDIEARRQEARAKKIKNKGDEQDIDMRKQYAEQIFALVSLYMFAVFFILILPGSPSSFTMSDTVLVTLLGTTTANVIGVLVIVAKYLFPKR